MLTRDQLYEMMLMRSRENSLFSTLPNEVLQHIAATNNSLAEINEALRLAASSIEKDMVKLAAMIKTNPRLLLQAGNVMTRGGVEVMRTTLYEFFLGAGDPDGAKRIQFGFADIPNGEAERLCQYKRYKPHIDALAKQIELKIPAYDLIPLFDVIKQSSLDDINEALNLNNPNLLSMRNTPLRKALVTFRKAVSPKAKTVGMHYDHYTTALQAFYLLDIHQTGDELPSNILSIDKCYLIWHQIIGYLQRSLPAIDRFGCAQRYECIMRTLQFKYCSVPAFFPDCNNDDLDFISLGFDEMIFGAAINDMRGFGARMHDSRSPSRAAYFLENKFQERIFKLQNLCANNQPQLSAPRWYKK